MYKRQDWTCLQSSIVSSDSFVVERFDFPQSIFKAPTSPSCACVMSSSFHLGCLGVARKDSFSIFQCLSSIAYAVGVIHPDSSESLPLRSKLQMSSTELWTALPSEAGILAFRGSFCLDSQYFLGHCSYLFQEDGDNWCARKFSSISAPSAIPMVMSVS